ncbi:MAG: bifunctional phosphopantothenoylcysteine decarboxylase/phosphopantothenate--cysteine ligase CoaBC [Chloroflexi bacterium]|nr:bifunctional phosphopantothenoylcysteine decarboxylase/phosphopantothenate--cysteine ligase CoaBC [Chloroflexota bacterium]MCI0576057.1 bifunctional phosphopantothenoylcysteine decarboxylase/phosphopantothenate--cysteine ligase CoaBC [Chloroflexota bacterium]MCI0647845.1 bifunctional phosphopantothenoylcysteine decarboxylase/phosphopantothenate--cysteine ligase CoaBC [Chloroflexota bacterium]MCI0727096.1 bifunctional phosphopantothenoylcysteine decarboxylase/phosphopantothenate--cysteine liga
MTVSILLDKRIVLGVTGSIACYKAVDLASKLTQAGALVDVVLTESAGRFVTPLSFRSVTGRPVHDDLWNLDDHVRHVRLGEAADLLVIAPATAQTLAKLAHGLADNLLAVTALAARCPLLVAPAMDGGMYEHPATQANVRLLRERGVLFAGPAEGRMASGLVGTGRMVEPAELLGHIRLALGRNGPLAGRRVVVTAGPTEEPVDPVRFLSNRSSGRQGLALAQAALDAGAQVTLVAGPIGEALPVGVEHVPVGTAVEMRDAVLAAVARADALLMAAAVADFRPAQVAQQKIKKTVAETDDLAITLARNPDILAEVKAQKEKSGRPLVTLGFAAETENALAYGRDKLERKGLNFIAVNDVSAADAGFAVETNRVILLSADGSRVEMPLQSKAAVAEQLVQHVADSLETLSSQQRN